MYIDRIEKTRKELGQCGKRKMQYGAESTTGQTDHIPLCDL